MLEIRQKITKEYILSKISQEEIFEKYLGIPVSTTNYYKNPLRGDTGEGCRFYYDNRNVLKFHDFSMGWNWDCFNVVEYNNGGVKLSFSEALRKIAEDFSVEAREILQPSVAIKKKIVDIKIATVNWDNKNSKYWKEIFIDIDTLRHFCVKPLKAFWINNIKYVIQPNEPAYVYLFPHGKLKIYLPFREKGRRFYQNCSYLIQGLAQLPETGDHLVYTKSYKDVMSLFTFGITSVAPNSEVTFVNPEDYINLSNRFDNQFILYDNDYPGRKNTVKVIKKHSEITPLLFPKDMEKDWTDNLKKYKSQYMLDIIEHTKNELW